jgi:hypothetical protein
LDAADRPGAGGPDHLGRSDRPPLRRPPPTARYRLGGGRVLLVDDLATTGGTLAGAAAALRHAGARVVEATVLAAAPAALGPGPAPPATRRSRSLPQATRRSGSVPSAAESLPLPAPPGFSRGLRQPRAPPGPWPRECLAPPRQALGLVGRGVSRWGYDRDLPCSWRSHCVVVTRFRV